MTTIEYHVSEPIAAMSRERLHELVWTKTPSELSALTGVGRDSHRCHCGRLAVPMPPRGYFRNPDKMAVPELPPEQKKPKAPVVQRRGNEKLRLLDREEIHRLVWGKAVRTVAAGIGVSDVALAKRCRLLNIPIPPRGYWRKLETGAVPQVPPLPQAPEDYEERQRIEVDFRDADNSRSEGADDLLVKGTAFVRDLMWAMPIPSIRANYGISRFSLNRYCRENNIAVPGRGYWKNSSYPTETGHRDSESSTPAAHHVQEGDSSEDRSDVSVEALDGSVHSALPVTQTVDFEQVPPTVSLSAAAMTDRLKTEFDAMRLLWREPVDAWLATFPNQTSNAVRRSQVLNGLFAVVRSGRVVNSSDLVHLTSEEIDRICDEFLFNGTNRNSVRAYRSMLKSFRAYLEPQSAETSETASSPGLEVLFEPSAHKGLYREWELHARYGDRQPRDKGWVHGGRNCNHGRATRAPGASGPEINYNDSSICCSIAAPRREIGRWAFIPHSTRRADLQGVCRQSDPRSLRVCWSRGPLCLGAAPFARLALNSKSSHIVDLPARSGRGILPTDDMATYEDDSFGRATNFSRPAPGREGTLRKACRRRTKSATASADQTGSKHFDPAFRTAVGRGASPLSIAIERARVSGKSRKAATTSVRISTGHSPGRYLVLLSQKSV